MFLVLSPLKAEMPRVLNSQIYKISKKLEQVRYPHSVATFYFGKSLYYKYLLSTLFTKRKTILTPKRGGEWERRIAIYN